MPFDYDKGGGIVCVCSKFRLVMESLTLDVVGVSGTYGCFVRY